MDWTGIPKEAFLYYSSRGLPEQKIADFIFNRDYLRDRPSSNEVDKEIKQCGFYDVRTGEWDYVPVNEEIIDEIGKDHYTWNKFLRRMTFGERERFHLAGALASIEDIQRKKDPLVIEAQENKEAGGPRDKRAVAVSLPSLPTYHPGYSSMLVPNGNRRLISAPGAGFDLSPYRSSGFKPEASVRDGNQKVTRHDLGADGPAETSFNTSSKKNDRMDMYHGWLMREVEKGLSLGIRGDSWDSINNQFPKSASWLWKTYFTRDPEMLERWPNLVENRRRNMAAKAERKIRDAMR